MKASLIVSVVRPSVRPFSSFSFIYLYIIIILQPKISFAAYIYITYIAAHKNSVSRSDFIGALAEQDTTHHVTTKLLQSSGAGGVWQHQLGHSINTQDATTGVDKTLRYHSSISDISGIDDCKIIFPK